MTDRQVVMTEEQLRALVSSSVRETLLLLGVDASNPIEMQRDFQHLREWRLTVTRVKSKGVLTMLTILVSGTAAAFWVGFKEILGGR